MVSPTPSLITSHTTSPSPLPSTLSPSQTLFWDHSSVFSQWYPSSFTVDNERYNCAEQYMMSEKAKLFGDTATRRKIMSSPNPAQQKRFGRSVPSFNQELWVQHRYDIVFKADLAKCSAPPLLQQLVDTGDKFLAEASPYDLVWGIGFTCDDRRALQPPLWPGLNLLGDILMKIRHQLASPPPLPPPLRASRVLPSENGIHEISATVPAPTPHSTLDHLLPPFLPEATPPHALVSAISSGATLPSALPSLIAEHGPGLSSGIVTVDDASFTTRIKVHSGPSASNRYGLVARLDTGSPQTFISAEAWACMKRSNAASDACEQHTSPCSWGGFGKSAPLLSSISV